MTAHGQLLPSIMVVLTVPRVSGEPHRDAPLRMLRTAAPLNPTASLIVVRLRLGRSPAART